MVWASQLKFHDNLGPTAKRTQTLIGVVGVCGRGGLLVLVGVVGSSSRCVLVLTNLSCSRVWFFYGSLGLVVHSSFAVFVFLPSR